MGCLESHGTLEQATQFQKPCRSGIGTGKGPADFLQVMHVAVLLARRQVVVNVEAVGNENATIEQFPD